MSETYQAFDWLDEDPDFTRNTLIVLGRELWGGDFYEELATALLDEVSPEQELVVVKQIRKKLKEKYDAKL
jgi:hypothetical protein